VRLLDLLSGAFQVEPTTRKAFFKVCLQRQQNVCSAAYLSSNVITTTEQKQTQSRVIKIEKNRFYGKNTLISSYRSPRCVLYIYSMLLTSWKVAVARFVQSTPCKIHIFTLM